MSAHPKPLLHSKLEMRTVPAGEFKAKCLGLIDEVNAGAGEVLITKRGKPVARLVPIKQEQKPFRSLWGRTPSIAIPDNFEELRDSLALDWADPIEKWNRIENPGKRKKK